MSIVQLKKRIERLAPHQLVELEKFIDGLEEPEMVETSTNKLPLVCPQAKAEFIQSATTLFPTFFKLRDTEIYHHYRKQWRRLHIISAHTAKIYGFNKVVAITNGKMERVNALIEYNN